MLTQLTSGGNLVNMTIQDYPKIIAFTGSYDSGEYGNATCSHCGAKGRYYRTFVCDDGTARSAMSGCITLFPMSPLAKEHSKVLDKVRSGRKLNNWDNKKLEAIEAVIAGTMSPEQALGVVYEQNRRRQEWLGKKGYR